MAIETNPANRAATAPERKRIPMSTPRRKLEVPEMPGYYLYWHLESNVPAAQQAGYEFVTTDEISVNQLNVATSNDISGNADLGSHVRVLAGVGADGKAEYHVLMKLRQEWRDEDQNAVDEQHAKRLGAIFQREQIIDGANKVSQEDQNLRYVKTAKLDRPGPLLLRPTRKGS